MFNIDLTKYRIIDLSYEVVVGQDDERPFLVKRGYLPDGTYKYDIHKTHSHVGTHIEVPAHFFEDGKSVTDFPVTAFMGRAILLPVRLTNLEITPDYLESTIGDIVKEGDIIVCRNEMKSVKLADQPFFTPAAAEWFKKHKVKMLVIGGAIRLGKDIAATRQFHDILMSGDVNFVEFVTSLDQLKKREFYFMALPFKVKGLDSSWARAIAIEEI